MKPLISLVLLAIGFVLFVCSCLQSGQFKDDPTIQNQDSGNVQKELEEEFGSPSSAFYRGFDVGKGAIEKKNVARLLGLFTHSMDPTLLEKTDEYILGNNSCMPLGWEVEFTLTSKSGKDTLVEFKLNDEKFGLGFVDGEIVYFLFFTKSSFEEIIKLIGANKEGAP